MAQTITIRGKRWRLIFEKLHARLEAWGYCDDPSTPNKSIHIDSRLEGEQLVNIILHEGIHASFWDLSEEAAEEYARDMARVLQKCGLIRHIRGDEI